MLPGKLNKMMSGVLRKSFEYLKWSAPGATVINTQAVGDI
jgi:hypothetical protein